MFRSYIPNSYFGDRIKENLYIYSFTLTHKFPSHLTLMNLMMDSERYLFFLQNNVPYLVLNFQIYMLHVKRHSFFIA